MENKHLGYGLLGTVGLFVFLALFDESMRYETAEGMYSLVGLGFVVFGVWGGIRLIK